MSRVDNYRQSGHEFLENACFLKAIHQWHDGGQGRSILHKIGGWGMDLVYEAEYLKLGRHVALKFLPVDLAHGPQIFVHCRLGNDRTGMMIAAFRMGAQGWTAEQAMKEMHFFGYTTVHHLMCPGLPVARRVFQSVWRKVETNPEQMPRI